MLKSDLIDSLKKKGFKAEIVEAFEKVRREDFIQYDESAYAYEDVPMPIGYEQTISQPSTIAFMLNLLDLQKGHKILEIGSGSGYVLALMSEIIKEGKIYGIERIKELAIRSRKVLRENKIVEIINRNGVNGLPERGPFDRMLISASCKEVPRQLYAQLKDPGVMVAAVKQSIFQIKKENGNIVEKEFPGFAFVPFIE